MKLSGQPESFYDEKRYSAIMGDSATRSRLTKIEIGRVSFGSLSASDSRDYYRITIPAGTFAIVVTGDPANGFSGTAASNFSIAMTDWLGNVKIAPTQALTSLDSYTEYLLVTDVSGSNYYVAPGTYYIEIANTTGKSLSYAVSALELNPPTILGYSPQDGATGVAVDANIELAFSEKIYFYSGSLLLKNADGTLFERFNVATSTRLKLADNVLTIDPTAVLAAGKRYTLEIEPGALCDWDKANINKYAGTTTYDFTTAPAGVPSVRISDNQAASANANSTVIYTLKFSEAVSGLAADDFTVGNGSLAAVWGNGDTWQVAVTPAAGVASGRIDLALKAGAVTDIDGNANAATSYAIQSLDTTAPAAPYLLTNTSFRKVVDPRVALHTNLGDVVLELNPSKAPISVANMLAYVNSGFYGGTIFHRVIANFMAQAGGFAADLAPKDATRDQIPLESANGLANLRGTVGMARQTGADTGTSQFYINLVDNANLDYASTSSPGYAVFGYVVSGMEVIDRIAKLPTVARGGLSSDVPFSDVIITSAEQSVMGQSASASGLVFVDALETDSRWEYSLNGGSLWSAGSGATFNLTAGQYGAGDVLVRQIDAAGNMSESADASTGVLIADAALLSSQAVDVATGAITGAAIGFAFAKDIQRGTGTLLLKNAAGATVESFNVATSDRVSIAGPLLTLSPTTTLAAGSKYSVVFAAGTVLVGGTANIATTRSLTTRGKALVGTGNNDNLLGSANGESLSGGGGNDLLDGKAGADNLTGGSGDDTYVIDNIGDTIVEASTEGTDLVRVAVVTAGGTYRLGSEIENAALINAVAYNVEGNELANQLIGNAAANRIIGGAGNDSLNGGGGADILVGGSGDDSYQVDNAADVIVETAASGLDTVRSTASYVLAMHLENLILDGSAANGTGNVLANQITGTTAANRLDGGGGADVLSGGVGNDTYVIDDAADQANEATTGGTDTIESWIAYTLSDNANIEHLTLVGLSAFSATGNSGNNTLTGNAIGNLLDGKGGLDSLKGGLGDDTYLVDLKTTGSAATLAVVLDDTLTENASQGSDRVALRGEVTTLSRASTLTLPANLEDFDASDTGVTKLNLTGNTGDNRLTGNGADNILNGSGGNDFLDGGAGIDSLIGGTGNDSYLLNDTDVVTEVAGGGTDTVLAAISYSFADKGKEQLENLTLTGSSDVNGTGNALANVLIGNAGRNRLDGGTGNDSLDGGAGADELIGGTGNDSYLVDDSGDTVSEISSLASEIDMVRSAVTFTLGANLENLTLTGSAAIDGSGNTLANTITGNDAANALTGDAGNDTLVGGAGNDSLDGGVGNDLLDGGLGADLLAGGVGDDSYLIDNLGDQISEAAGAGNDTVRAAIGWTLTDQPDIENLILLGTANSDVAGNDGANVLTGNTGANMLTGGGGVDSLIGGLGDDTYVVNLKLFNNAAILEDAITELASQGTDTLRLQGSVESSAASTILLAATLEHLDASGTGATRLTLKGNTAANNITGNDADNLIDGGGGNDLLDGGTGADTLIGGAGDDIFIVGVGDTVTEAAGGGTDTVRSTVAYTFFDKPNLENLILLGSADLAGTGNALANVLQGNGGSNTLTGDAGNDRLDGGAGGDTLIGGKGNDTYVVDDIGDVVSETTTTVSEIDLVLSAVDFSLANRPYLEHITLTGTADSDATGNTLANTLTGNSGANLLSGDIGNDLLDGGAGNDMLIGGAGTDTLKGGSGDDIYVVNVKLSGTGAAAKAIFEDTVTELANAGADTLRLEGSLNLAVATTLVVPGTLEHLDVAGTDFTKLNLTGTAVANSLVGNNADNLIDGGGGADTLKGGFGNDTYLVDNLGDIISEASGDGVDLVKIGIAAASGSYTLAANVEQGRLTNSVAFTLAGNASGNALAGNAAGNTLDGGAGADTLTGFAGDDTYVVDDAGDLIEEAASAGSDTVRSSITWSLADNLEHLTLTGGSSIDGTGNGVANMLVGNAAANHLNGGAGDDSLDGGAGNDTLVGGTGNDVYVIDSTADVVTELPGEGADLIKIGIATTGGSYTLPTAVENASLTNTVAYNLLGNGLANSMTGNAAANSLDGSTGADVLIGGAGDDTYRVDLVADASLEDIISEATGGGIDTLILRGSANPVTAQTIGLSNGLANLDHLDASGTGATQINLTGNALANNITGNNAANTMNGDAGNDKLIGGGGADTLNGGTGNDTYEVNLRLGDAGDLAVLEDAINEDPNAGVDSLVLKGYVSLSSATTLALSGSLANIEHLDVSGAVATYATPLNLTGNTADNNLVGNGAANVFVGGAGDDSYGVGGGDTVIEAAGEGTDTISASVTWSLAGTPNIENLTLTGSSALNATGNAAANRILGNGGNNILTGGAGNDTYGVDNSGDSIVEAADEGGDLVQASVSWTLGDNLEYLTLLGSSPIDGSGNAAANQITGNSSANKLTGLAGVDTLAGGAGNDTYVVNLVLSGSGDSAVAELEDLIAEAMAAGTDTVSLQGTLTLASATTLVLTGDLANFENLDISGTGSTRLNLTGNTAANLLTGNEADNVLTGGAGNDTYVVASVGDTVVELAGEGTDAVQTAITWTLADKPNLENLTLTGSAAIDATGNGAGNLLTGNSGANTLAGGAGNDTYVVGSGDSIVEAADEGSDTVQAGVSWNLADQGNVEHLTLTGSDPINGLGNGLVNTLTGNSGANSLDGAGGADTLSGGGGNDTYVVDLALVGSAVRLEDTVTESGAADTGDIVMLRGSQSLAVATTLDLPTNVEHLDVSGTGSTLLSLRGNSSANRLVGNDAANTLTGGAGNDTYVVGSGDSVVEIANEGTDLVEAAVSWTLAAGVDNLTLMGGDALDGAGNDLANLLTGNAGANALSGGAGDDTYVVGSGDSIIELASAGTDTVQSAISWSLAELPSLENLILTGSDAVNATGNDGANELTGNGGANRLDGGAGADTLTGGVGNDTYLVNLVLASGVATLEDTISEASNADAADVLQLQGSLTLTTASTLTLPSNVDNLDASATGSTLLNLSGNSSNNWLTGNDATNILTGGAGNDSYVVNDGDTVIENSGAGTDTIMASATWSLATASAVENLVLTGEGASDGTGNGLDNALTGNAAANRLTGGDGNDLLTGGGGADQFVMNLAPHATTNFDRIADFVSLIDQFLLDPTAFAGVGDAGSLAAEAFAAGEGKTTAATAAERVLYDLTSGILYFDADGDGVAATPVAFAKLDNKAALTAGDFLVTSGG